MKLRGYLYNKIFKQDKEKIVVPVEIKKPTQRISSQVKSHELDEYSKNLLKRYVSSLENFDYIKLLTIFKVYKNRFDVYGKNKETFLQTVDHFSEYLQYYNSIDLSKSHSENIDRVSINKDTVEKILKILKDIEKLTKIIQKRDSEIDYSHIILMLNKLAEEKLEIDLNKTFKPIEVKIAQKLGKSKNIRNIVKEFMKITMDKIDPVTRTLIDEKPALLLVNKILKDFHIESDEESVKNIINECKEEIDLENFEKNIESNNKVLIEDFSKLNGYQFQKFLEKLFKHLGYTVIVNKLSGDMGADLVLYKDGEKTVVQAKKYFGKVSNNAIQEVVASKAYYGADKSMVITTGGFTASAIKLALSNKVELWDNKKLKNTLSKLKIRT